jgi:hypothetical protein
VVTVDVETRFMQNYRVATPVHAGSAVAAARNGAGDVELFTRADDGVIWNFHPDPTSGSGYRGVSTGLRGTTFATGRDKDGRLVLLAADGPELARVTQTGRPGAPWSEPSPLPYHRQQHDPPIVRILAENVTGLLYVALLFELDVMHTKYGAWSAIWDEERTEFRPVPMAFDGTDCVWLRDLERDDVALACPGEHFVGCWVNPPRPFDRGPIDDPGSATSAVAAAPDATGRAQIFAVVDGDARRLTGDEDNGWRWTPLSGGLHLRGIEAVAGPDGGVHLFGVDGTNRLYHWTPRAIAEGGSRVPAVIATGVASVTATSNDEGEIDLFTVGTAIKTVTHLFREDVSTNWVSQIVEVPDGGKVEEYISYTSDVQVYDGAGSLLAMAPVQITAAEETRIAVNGGVYVVGPRHPAHTSTNTAGALSIAQETGTLAIPALGLHVAGHMAADETISLEQSTEVQHRLAAVDGPELMSAADAAGAPLLPAGYRTAESTDALAQGLNRCMSMIARGPVDHVALAGIHRSNRGVGMLSGASLSQLTMLGPPAVEQHWRLAFGPDGIRFEDLPAAAARALIAEQRTLYASANGAFDWLSDIGDFLAGVVSGVIEIVQTIATTVIEGVRAAVTCVIDGATLLFEAVVSAVEYAFDLAEATFANIAVTFDRLFEWLGFLFSWPDILRTRDALAHLTGEMLGFIEGAVAGTRTIVGRAIDELQRGIDSAFDQAVASVAGTKSITELRADATQTVGPFAGEFAVASSNNIVLDGVIQNGASAVSLSATTDGAGLAGLDEVMRELTRYGESVAESPAFASAVEYFSDLGGSPERMFTQALAGLLRVAQGLAGAMLSGARLVIDALLNAVQTMIRTMRELLAETWQIPFVSDLYREISGGKELSMLDVTALLQAVPATAMYKAVEGSAPFPDTAAVLAFKETFNARKMLAAAGLAPAPLAAPTASPAQLRKMKIFVAIAGGHSTYTYGVMSASCDVVGSYATMRQGQVLSSMTWVAETVGLACECPWYFDDGPPGCTTPEGRERVHWCVGACGVVLDLVFVIFTKRITENYGNTGVAIAVAYGVADAVAAIAASVDGDAATWTTNLLPLVPEISKFMLCAPIVKATKELSPLLVGAIDIGCFAVTAGYSTWAALEEIGPPTP